MGVPKFYRWISERYPCLSEIVKEYQIPNFDNLYLDMNGIIHTCSHPNDNDPHFRISEEQIFIDIFHYIDFLFKTIKPKKVFYMAIDGVAPRAKMNQQRGRRFRSAKDAEMLEKRAMEAGETLPSEARFDSNCITPGTEFMAKLHDKLKYFVSYKVSTDKLWKDVSVYLSGHETPGEGEHKIMDYIRYQRSQSNYDPNTTHCLYGLDADLIMLGLCSHEPHFSLLREEVKYGKKAIVKKVVPEEITFHLLHLSLLRDYIELEFGELKEKLSFEFNLENIIDDWILMGFLIGNDFIPNIPNLHVKNDALPILYLAYIELLPTLDGYMNEAGTLNVQRFEKFAHKLSQLDLDSFNKIYCDFPQTKPSRDIRLAEIDELDAVTSHLKISDEEEESSEEEMDDDEDEDELKDCEFTAFKHNYYKEKLEFEEVTEEVLQSQADGYVKAIQWNLHYYYNGIASWSWFFPHHYSPFISDLKNLRTPEFEFDLGEPFLPFQQLLGVLPAASKSFLPKLYQQLMTQENSKLKKFFPEDFHSDLNGKTQEWEAVVLIPFIDEQLLVECSNEIDSELTEDEQQRNTHGPHLLYKYTDSDMGKLNGFSVKMPDLVINHALCETVDGKFYRLPKNEIKKGLLDGVLLDVCYPGFPTLKHLSHRSKFERSKVRVFQQASHSYSLMLSLENRIEEDLESFSKELLGKPLYVNWPYLTESIVKSVSNSKTEYYFQKNGKLGIKDLDKMNQTHWHEEVKNITETLASKKGILVDKKQVLVEVNVLSGVSYMCDKNGQFLKKKLWSTLSKKFLLQTTVSDLKVFENQQKPFESALDLFTPGSNCFIIGDEFFGCKAEVINYDPDTKKIKVKCEVKIEPDLSTLKKLQDADNYNRYVPHFKLGQRLGLNSHIVSRMTGSIYLKKENAAGDSKPVNIGLNLKFNKKNQEVPGYTKRLDDGTWVYTENVADLIKEYTEKFPKLFEKLSKLSRNADNIDYLLLFDSEGDLLEVLKWIKSLPTNSIEHRDCGGRYVEDECVKDLEKYMKDFLKTHLDESKTPFMLTKPNILYCPFISSLPDIKPISTELFDRVINIKEGSAVPLGLRGTVIGFKKGENELESLYDILFDEEFLGALAIRGSSNCCFRMSSASFINISGKSKTEKQPLINILKKEAKANDNRDFQKAWNSMPTTNKSHEVKYGQSISVQELFGSAKKGYNQSNQSLDTQVPFIAPIPLRPSLYPTDQASHKSNSPVKNISKPQSHGYPSRHQNPQSANYQRAPIQSFHSPNHPSNKGQNWRPSNHTFTRQQVQESSNYLPRPRYPPPEHQFLPNDYKSHVFNMYPRHIVPLIENCRGTFSNDPEILHSKLGPKRLDQVYIRLPNGQNFCSKPYPKEEDAVIDVVLQALVYLKSLTNKFPQAPLGFASNPSLFHGGLRFPFHGENEGNLSNIPSSYVQQNNKLLNQFQSPQESASSNQGNSSSQPMFVPKQVERKHLLKKTDTQDLHLAPQVAEAENPPIAVQSDSSVPSKPKNSPKKTKKESQITRKNRLATNFNKPINS